MTFVTLMVLDNEEPVEVFALKNTVEFVRDICAILRKVSICDSRTEEIHALEIQIDATTIDRRYFNC